MFCPTMLARAFARARIQVAMPSIWHADGRLSKPQQLPLIIKPDPQPALVVGQFEIDRYYSVAPRDLNSASRRTWIHARQAITPHPHATTPAKTRQPTPNDVANATQPAANVSARNTGAPQAPIAR